MSLSPSSMTKGGRRGVPALVAMVQTEPMRRAENFLWEKGA
jgi:hypothetical protein